MDCHVGLTISAMHIKEEKTDKGDDYENNGNKNKNKL